MYGCQFDRYGCRIFVTNVTQIYIRSPLDIKVLVVDSFASGIDMYEYTV